MLALRSVRLLLLVVYRHRVRGRRGFMILKSGRKRGFTCTNMIMRPVWPVNRRTFKKKKKPLNTFRNHHIFVLG